MAKLLRFLAMLAEQFDGGGGKEDRLCVTVRLRRSTLKSEILKLLIDRAPPRYLGALTGAFLSLFRIAATERGYDTASSVALPAI